jgi:hypothetical protein
MVQTHVEGEEEEDQTWMETHVEGEEEEDQMGWSRHMWRIGGGGGGGWINVDGADTCGGEAGGLVDGADTCGGEAGGGGGPCGGVEDVDGSGDEPDGVES